MSSIVTTDPVAAISPGRKRSLRALIRGDIGCVSLRGRSAHNQLAKLLTYRAHPYRDLLLHHEPSLDSRLGEFRSGCCSGSAASWLIPTSILARPSTSSSST
ncbi:hypothetical protein IVA95_29195 [Bradyrhizobium sp. 157]|uniref:hypothetical protein n=1 Tax=Bradyrhizobium sp. 157 TaxID=2782631 RepID=UPI001FFB07E1|nr:hypothetical protein [Bradyrhizobium sp. 157]MCK1641512.1 hypothetical protein [Bradyrhizobium sp. 157]